ncbi:TetR family transcriptional regulator [Sinomonas cellulolyticus]|uniref:TetR/AcrR family transcriptional regulator n=1 Tax=Sinomonas cellulolyticus TaxID=2801916 RepID=A0ABS1K2T7_9MICC|nr:MULTISPECIES: TetR/AcrR family transcriptional regulator [Sinomonas]MBL0705864.1 TetR/AcrR family transcriptional regulator [Sinomonas cellulolyticus]GHG42387.1 TetR family transcriptional regulator [Sinomonas sp. KCTC 49339]
MSGQSPASARTEATRQKLFDAAMELIGQRGAAAVTVDEIAAAAGVAKGTVYYNFGSKDGLVEQLLRHGMALLRAALAAAVAPQTPDGGTSPRTRDDQGAARPPLHEVRAMVANALGFIEAYPAFVRLWMGEQWRPDGTWHSVLAGMRAEVLGEIHAALARVGRPLRPGQDLDAVATALFGASFVVGVDRVSAMPAKPMGPAVEAVVALAAGAFWET